MTIKWKPLRQAVWLVLAAYLVFKLALAWDHTNVGAWILLLLIFGGAWGVFELFIVKLFEGLVAPNILQPGVDFEDNGRSLKEMKKINAERRARVEAARREGRL